MIAHSDTARQLMLWLCLWLGLLLLLTSAFTEQLGNLVEAHSSLKLLSCRRAIVHNDIALYSVQALLQRGIGQRLGQLTEVPFSSSKLIELVRWSFVFYGLKNERRFASLRFVQEMYPSPLHIIISNNGEI